MAKVKENTAAMLTIYHAPAMTFRGRVQIAKWLIGRAWLLVRHGKSFTEGRFTARYMYV